MSVDEIWKIIPDFEDYSASNFGRIINNKTKKILKPGSNGKYNTVCLWKNRKLMGTKYIHRLVLHTFNTKPDGIYECSHIDGNRHNNSLINLKWETPRENNFRKIEHGTFMIGDSHVNTKISNEECVELIKLYISGSTTKELSKKYKITDFHVAHILSGRARKSLPYCPYAKLIVKRKTKEFKAKTARENSRGRKNKNSLSLR